MNKVAVLSQQYTAGQPSTMSEQRRSPPRAVKILLPVWGYNYVSQFLEYGLPTLLAPGNVPALVATLPTEFIILTSTNDEEFLINHSAFKRLAGICRTVLRPIDHLITLGIYSTTTLTLAYAEAVRAANGEMIDTCFFLLVSDYIISDGSLANVLKRMQLGASAVVAGNFQVVSEDARPWLATRSSCTGKIELALTSRELVRWGLDHLHPTTLANTVNIPFTHNSHTNRLFWRVDDTTILGRFYLMHALCVRPEIMNFVVGSSFDYSFVPEMCPSGNVEAVADSDEYLVVEMQPRAHELALLRPGPINPTVLGKSLSEWTTAAHRANARYSLVFRAGDVPPDLERITKRADSFIREIARHLTPKPMPFRGHPYWRSAMAAFAEATGCKLTKADQPFAQDVLIGSHSFPRWLARRVRRAAMGRPPRVLPWHPLWPDYKILLREIGSFFTDQNQRLLMVSSEPTVLTVGLSRDSERVRYLPLASCLHSSTKRYDAYRGTYHLCLLELSHAEVPQLLELVGRIVPLIKAGGSIVVYVRDRQIGRNRNVRDIQGYLSTIGAQLIRSDALPLEVRVVPAGGLRGRVHRGFADLSKWIRGGGWLRIPFAVGGGIILLCLSLIANRVALRRSRQAPSSGLMSSMIIRLSAGEKT